MNTGNDDFEESEENEEENDLILSKDDKENKSLTKIWNSSYDIDTLYRITIVRLSQCGMPQKEIRKILNVSRALTSKWVNYAKMQQKKIGRPLKFSEE